MFRRLRNPAANVFGPKKPLFGPYTYRAKQNSNGDTLIGVYVGSKRIAHMDAYWAYSMRSIEDREEEVKQRGRGRSCATDLRALGAEGKYPNVLAVSHAFVTDDEHKGKGVGRAMYEAMMVEGFAVRQSRIGGQPGPMFFIPDECSGAGNTSAEARRVWASLVRDYPSQGTSIRVDAPPVIGSRKRVNPRRRRNPVNPLFPDGTLIAYHGGPSLVGGKFDLAYVGRGEGSSFPGIFFSNVKGNAEEYAKWAPLGENYVYTVRLDARGFYSDERAQPLHLRDRLLQLVKDIGADNLPRRGSENRYGLGNIGKVIQKLGPVEGPKALIRIGVTGQVRYWGPDLFEVAVLDPSVVTVLSVEKVSVPRSLQGRKQDLHREPYDPLFDKGPAPLAPLQAALVSAVRDIEGQGFRVPAAAKASPEGFIAWASTVEVPAGKREEDFPAYLRLLDEADAAFGEDNYGPLMDKARTFALRKSIYNKRDIERALEMRRDFLESEIRRGTPRELPVFRNPRRRNPSSKPVEKRLRAFFADFDAQTVPCPFDKQARMFPDVPVSIILEDGEVYATIAFLQAHPSIRASGAGTEAMRRILDLADKHGVRLFLDPVPLDKGWSWERLVRWYASFGFVFEEPDEEEREASGLYSMLREPGAKGARRPNPRRRNPDPTVEVFRDRRGRFPA